MDAINEIKNRIHIEELVAQYVTLKKVGRNFKALCPFHKERTPSFHVSPEKQLAYCFGCHKGGDHFKFVEEIEGVDFKGALKILAEKAGVDLPKLAPFDKKKASERDRLIELHEKATAFFEDQLWNTPDGKKVLGYLKKRDLKEETIKHAHIGYSPDARDLLFKYLLKENFTKSEITASGLAISHDLESGECVDRFRGRLMFPIQNLAGDVCAFGGRALADGQEPKYLNSPETSIFHKSSFLYGLSAARAEVRNIGKIILVEGYMDALSVFQAGFKNVVACGGTALTDNQLATMKRFAKEVLFSFDRDLAGQTATMRAIELAFEQDIVVRVVVWESDAKDPDECVRENEKLFEKALKDAAPATEYLVEYLKKQFDLNSAPGKRQVIRELLPFFARLKSPVELDEWIKNCSRTLDISNSSIYDELKLFQGRQKKPYSLETEHLENRASRGKELQLQEYLVGLLLTYPEVRSLANQLVAPKDFDDNELQNIYRSLSSEYNQGSLELTAKEKERADLLSLYIESKHDGMGWDTVENEVTQSVKSLLRQRIDREKRSLLTQLRTSEGKEKAQILEAYQQLLERESKITS